LTHISAIKKSKLEVVYNCGIATRPKTKLSVGRTGFNYMKDSPVIFDKLKGSLVISATMEGSSVNRQIFNLKSSFICEASLSIAFPVYANKHNFMDMVVRIND